MTKVAQSKTITQINFLEETITVGHINFLLKISVAWEVVWPTLISVVHSLGSNRALLK